jgi:hypothetical protein
MIKAIDMKFTSYMKENYEKMLISYIMCFKFKSFFLTAFVMQIITIGAVHVVVFGEIGGKMRTDKS